MMRNVADIVNFEQDRLGKLTLHAEAVVQSVRTLIGWIDGIDGRLQTGVIRGALAKGAEIASVELGVLQKGRNSELTEDQVALRSIVKEADAASDNRLGLCRVCKAKTRTERSIHFVKA